MAETLPENLDAEESILGSALLSNSVLASLMADEGLQAQDFSSPGNAIIYQAMVDLYNGGKPVDALTLTEHLRRKGSLEDVGGQGTLELLTLACIETDSFQEYARIIKNAGTLRRLLAASHNIQALISKNRDDPKEIVDKAQQLILDVTEEQVNKDFLSLDDITDIEIAKLREIAARGGSLTGISTGFESLDELTNGFHPGNLIVLAARPSMGKSALMSGIAQNVAESGRVVALFSLEMSEQELFQRFLSSTASVSSSKLRRGELEGHEEDIASAAKHLSELPLFVDTTGDVNVFDVRNKSRRLYQREGDLGLIMVDYLQLMRSVEHTDNRVEQVGQICRSLKSLAKELNVPIVLIAQLNRSVESREDKRPLLSDLRDSGNIEEHADLVMFIYRRSYYDRDSQDDGKTDLLISKHRNGRLGSVNLEFESEFVRFNDFG